MSDILTHPAVYSAETSVRRNRMMWLKSLIAGLAIPLSAACASPNSDTDTSVVAAPDSPNAPATAEPFPSASPDIDQPSGSDTGDTAPENTGTSDIESSGGIWPLEQLYQWRETATPPECGPVDGESAVSVVENPDGSLELTLRIWNADEIGSQNNVIASVDSFLIDRGVFISSRLVQLKDGIAKVNIPADQASDLKSNPANNLSTTFTVVPGNITPDWILANLPNQGEMGLPNMGKDENGVVHDTPGVAYMYMVILTDGLKQKPPDIDSPFFYTAKSSHIQWNGQEWADEIDSFDDFAYHNPELFPQTE